MIRIRRLKELEARERDTLFNRFGDDFSTIMVDTVIPIVNEVRARGDHAVLRYTEKFDKVVLNSLLATEEEIESAYRSVSPEILEAFSLAKENIEEFHLRQRRDHIMYTRADGTTLGVRFEPIERAAIYVPGGKASYPSSVLMGAIPARIAGTGKITVITPPGRDGSVDATVLAVCRMLGIDRVVKAGGAQGIAAAGCGTESVGKSDIIVGPGNIYVTAAKSYLFSLGLIAIDSMAGPSEVLIIADEGANPRWAAYDLLSQAEHEETARAVLLTTSGILADKVRAEIEKDIRARTGRHQIKERAIERGMILLVDSIEEAVDFSNSYAPEHLELMVAEPMGYLQKLRNAGSLFLGAHAPVAVGDYYSGTNHILPTGGAARFSSGVGVDTFLRRTSFQHLTPGALRKANNAIELMSRVEGFDDKHGGSVRVRFEKE